MSAFEVEPQHDLSIWYREIEENRRATLNVLSEPAKRARAHGGFGASTESSRAKQKCTQRERIRLKKKGKPQDALKSRRHSAPPTPQTPVHVASVEPEHGNLPSCLAKIVEFPNLNNGTVQCAESMPVEHELYQSSRERITSHNGGCSLSLHSSTCTQVTETHSEPGTARQSRPPSVLQDLERARQLHRISVNYGASDGSKRISRRWSSSSRSTSMIYATPKTLPDNAMAALIINASRSMSLRKYMLWITLQDIHRFQSIHHAKAYDVESISEPSIIVLRNLQILERMYRPGRVWLPSHEAWRTVETIHGTLVELKTEMEDRFQEIITNHDTMDGSEFVDWATHEYRIDNRKMRPAREGFRHNPDSVRGQQDAVRKAMDFYQSPSVLHESSATNIFAEVLVKVLATYLVPKQRHMVKLLKSLVGGKDRSEFGDMERRLSNLGRDDVLVWRHPASF